MTTIPNTIEFQGQGRKFVDLHVYACLSSLVDYIVQKSIEDDKAPISYDELGLQIDPSEWKAAQIKAYIDDNFGSDWAKITGTPWLFAHSDDSLATVREWIEENITPTNILDWARFKSLEGGLEDWGAQTLFDLVTGYGTGWEEITDFRFDATISDDEDRWEEEIEKAKDYIRDNATPREPLEWWAVSSWLGQELKNRGYIIVDVGGGLVIWGRETSGQAIFMDGVIEAITVDWLKARGELE